MQIGRTLKDQLKDFKVTLSYNTSGKLSPFNSSPLIVAYKVQGIAEVVWNPFEGGIQIKKTPGGGYKLKRRRTERNAWRQERATGNKEEAPGTDEVVKK